MAYIEKEINNLGTLKFLGNLGAVALFEDYVGASFLSRFSAQPRLGDLVKLAFFSYKIACKRLDVVAKYTLDDFEENLGKDAIDVATLVLTEIMKEMGLDGEDGSQKKIAKKK